MCGQSRRLEVETGAGTRFSRESGPGRSVTRGITCPALLFLTLPLSHAYVPWTRTQPMPHSTEPERPCTHLPSLIGKFSW